MLRRRPYPAPEGLPVRVLRRNNIFLRALPKRPDVAVFVDDGIANAQGRERGNPIEQFRQSGR